MEARIVFSEEGDPNPSGSSLNSSNKAQIGTRGGILRNCEAILESFMKSDSRFKTLSALESFGPPNPDLLLEPVADLRHVGDGHAVAGDGHGAAAREAVEEPGHTTLSHAVPLKAGEHVSANYTFFRKL